MIFAPLTVPEKIHSRDISSNTIYRLYRSNCRDKYLPLTIYNCHKSTKIIINPHLVGGLVAIYGIFPFILGCIHHPN